MSTQERVAASFISQYFELLMTDAKQLVPQYVPKATFDHDGKSTSITGPDAIGRALTRLYRPNHGRVVIQDMKVADISGGHFSVSVGVTLYRRGSKDGEEYRYVLELKEHAGSNGSAYGIVNDIRKDLNKPGPSLWAMETPPMFAKTGNEAAIPELVQPPATTVVAEPAVAKEPTPKLQPAAAPEEVKVEEAAAVVVPVAEEKAVTIEAETAPVVEAAPSQPAAPATKPSFADLVRAAAPKTTSAVAPTRVEAKTEATKAKEEAEKAAKEEEAKKAAKKDDKDGKRKSKKDDKEADAPAKKSEEGEKKAAASNRKENQSKNINNQVVFYDVIVKGLSQDATDKSVAAMVSSIAAVKKINLKSQPDKKDASIMRTFAFVLFDHDAIVASGSTVKDVIVKVQKEIRTKYGHQRIQVDEVREKFTQEEPREKTEA